MVLFFLISYFKMKKQGLKCCLKPFKALLLKLKRGKKEELSPKRSYCLLLGIQKAQAFWNVFDFSCEKNGTFCIAEVKTLRPILPQYKEKEGRRRKNRGGFHLYFSLLISLSFTFQSSKSNYSSSSQCCWTRICSSSNDWML